MSSSEATPPSSSTDSSQSPPSPPSTSTSPPLESTPPPSPPAATPPPPSQPPPSPTPSPPTSPPPAPPTSSSPPPASTPPSSPPPSTPATSESPPPPEAAVASPPPPAQSPPSPTSSTPSTPPPAQEAAPAQNPPPQAADSPPVPAYSPPQPTPISPPAPPSLAPNPPHSGSAARPTGSSSSPTPPSSSNDNQNVNGGFIVGIVLGGIVIIALLMAVIICLICSRKKRKPDYYNGANQYYNQSPSQWHDANAKLHPPAGSFMGAPVGGGWGAPPSGEFSTGGYSGQHPMMAMPPSQNMGGMTQFSYEELAAATNGFSQTNLLGQGGFGLVHKGVLPDSREVAVKSLKSGSGQGEREFQAEVEIISRVHHRHLVSLVGYCIANEKKLLVYEFVPNKTLEFHLYGKDQPVIDWPTRLRIAVGSAKGLAYLHEDCLPRIIHRDIKAANILIDYNYEAMVADFGLAKLTTDNNTHVSTRVMGTFGYLAPEYASSGKLSEKSDVFSFGVMLLELITGRRPIDMSNMMEDSLVDWARPLLSKALEDGNYDELVDPRLEGKYAHHELSRMAASAAASIRHSARKRPKMSQIVRALEGDSSLDDLNEGVKPGQSGLYNPNGGTQVYDTRAYNADMMKFKKMVMASDEFNSSEYGNTSEYGLNPSVSTTDTDSDSDSTEMQKTSIDVQMD